MAKVELLKKKLAKAKEEGNKEEVTRLRKLIKAESTDQEQVEVKAKPKAKAKAKVVEVDPTRTPEVIVDTITELFKANQDEGGKLKFTLEELALIVNGETSKTLLGDIKRMLNDEKIHFGVVEDTVVLTKLNVYKKAKKLGKSVLTKAIKVLVQAEEAASTEEDEE